MKNLVQALVVFGLVNASPVLAHEGPIRSDVHVLLHLGFAATLLLAVGLGVVLWRMYYQRLRG
ncbi:MAG: hypothetical protein KTR33_05075 [Gammaproteobacteria bacterium]|nr:hypothetical protein [Gammaproteobacteria bacterium]